MDNYYVILVDCSERYHENMQRFVMQGSKFEPVRVQSATVRKARHIVHPRPHTAFVKRQSKPDLQERDLNSRRHIGNYSLDIHDY